MTALGRDGRDHGVAGAQPARHDMPRCLYHRVGGNAVARRGRCDRAQLSVSQWDLDRLGFGGRRRTDEGDGRCRALDLFAPETPAGLRVVVIRLEELVLPLGEVGVLERIVRQRLDRRTEPRARRSPSTGARHPRTARPRRARARADPDPGSRVARARAAPTRSPRHDCAPPARAPRRARPARPPTER